MNNDDLETKEVSKRKTKAIFFQNESRISIKPVDQTKEKSSLENKIKEIALEWILNSTSHGLPNLFKTSQKYLKIFWLIAFLACSGICFYLITEYIINFFEYEVTVSTTYVTETPVDFPAVTICNLNPFNPNRSSALFEHVSSTYNFNNSLQQVNETNAYNVIKKFLAYSKLESSSNPLYSPNRKSYGFYIDEMLVSCNAFGTLCSSSNFVFLQSYDYGNCYTFNSGFNSTKITTSSDGPGNSIEIELFSGDPNDVSYSYKNGFYVVVHNQSYTPIMDNEGVYVKAGEETNIGIERNFYYKLSNPFSNCVQDPTSVRSSTSELYQLILTNIGEKLYRQKFCFKLCYQIAVVNKCSCYDAAYANTNKTNRNILACHDTGKLSCKEAVSQNFSTTGWNTLCLDKCPIECTKVNYKTNIHSASYPSVSYIPYLLAQSSFTSKYSTSTQYSSEFKDIISKSIAKINIFYSDISYTAYTENETTNTETLFGNIGGALGLFIGISFLSLAELFEIFFEIIRIIYQHKKNLKTAST
jgi:hypothetical protein